MRLGLILLLTCSAIYGQGSCVCSGGVTTYEAGSEPACDESRRGSVIITLGQPGQPDLMKACTRDGAGRYSWSTAGSQNTHTFGQSRQVAGCPLFPDDNVWNSRVDALPVDASSAGIIGTYGPAKLGMAPGFFLNVADSSTPAGPVAFDSAESDGGKYPISPDMLLEGYGPGTNYVVSKGPYKDNDAHLLVLQKDECKLYEIFYLSNAAPPYAALSGAIYDLMGNNLRPEGWTSADAAGLPIWPGVLTYEELFGDGEIRHMLRFTVNKTLNTYIWPARHYASHNGDANLPPMGSRWRLKASFDETTCRANDHAGAAFPAEMQRVIRGLKQYGMILADNGISILISTDADPRWGDPNAEESPTYRMNGWSHCIQGRDFEVVNTAPLMVDPNSAAISQ